MRGPAEAILQDCLYSMDMAPLVDHADRWGSPDVLPSCPSEADVQHEIRNLEPFRLITHGQTWAGKLREIFKSRAPDVRLGFWISALEEEDDRLHFLPPLDKCFTFVLKPIIQCVACSCAQHKMCQTLVSVVSPNAHWLLVPRSTWLLRISMMFTVGDEGSL